MSRYYLLDINQYQKIVDRWNIENKQNEIILINRAIKGEMGLNEYIHRNELIKDYHLLKETKPKDLETFYIRHGAMEYIKQSLEKIGAKIGEK